MKTVVKAWWMVLLVGLLTGCKSKVYHVRGELDSVLKPDQCEVLMSQGEFQSLNHRLDQLVAEARLVREINQLKWYLHEIEKLTVLIKKTFTHEHSVEQYPSTYRWTFYKTRKMIRNKPVFTVEQLAIDQMAFPPEALSVVEDDDSIQYSWIRKVSLLEYCMTSETVFAWIRIDDPSQSDENRLEDYLLLNGVH